VDPQLIAGKRGFEIIAKYRERVRQRLIIPHYP
jgi:hypothetical protein